MDCGVQENGLVDYGEQENGLVDYGEQENGLVDCGVQENGLEDYRVQENTLVGVPGHQEPQVQSPIVGLCAVLLRKELLRQGCGFLVNGYSVLSWQALLI